MREQLEKIYRELDELYQKCTNTKMLPTLRSALTELQDLIEIAKSEVNYEEVVDYAKNVVLADHQMTLDGKPFTYEEAIIEAYRILYEKME